MWLIESAAWRNVAETAVAEKMLMTISKSLMSVLTDFPNNQKSRFKYCRTPRQTGQTWR